MKTKTSSFYLFDKIKIFDVVIINQNQTDTTNYNSKRFYLFGVPVYCKSITESEYK